MLGARERSNVRDRWNRHAAETFHGADAAGGGTSQSHAPWAGPKPSASGCIVLHLPNSCMIGPIIAKSTGVEYSERKLRIARSGNSETKLNP
jgi:hypothetical protein